MEERGDEWVWEENLRSKLWAKMCDLPAQHFSQGWDRSRSLGGRGLGGGGLGGRGLGGRGLGGLGVRGLRVRGLGAGAWGAGA